MNFPNIPCPGGSSSFPLLSEGGKAQSPAAPQSFAAGKERHGSRK